MAQTGSGLLITLDEIHHRGVDELRDIATAIQHLFREGSEVGFAGAGLSSAVSSVLNDEVLTFLRRADRHPLGRVPLDDVAAAIAEPIEHEGRALAATDAARAAEATGGYPFLIQLVGYHIWRQHPDAHNIATGDVDAGVLAALWRHSSRNLRSHPTPEGGELSATELANSPALDHPRRRQTQLRSEQIDQLVKDYQAGATLAALATKFKVHDQTVRHHLDRQKVTRRPYRKLSPASVAHAAELYQSGLSLRRVAEAVGSSIEALRNRLIEADVEMRSPGSRSR